MTVLYCVIVGTDDEINKMFPVVAGTIWLGADWRKHCSGQNVRAVCIVESGDLHHLKYHDYEPIMFHNKYDMERDHTIMDCLEEELVQRNKLEYERDFRCKVNL